MAKILLVGYIPELLQEPERLLVSIGHNVTMAPSYTSACEAIKDGLIDVAIFGFIVPEEERKQLAGDLLVASPAAKIIMIYFANVRNTELADALMPTTASAEEVLRAVNHLLNQGRDRAG